MQSSTICVTYGTFCLHETYDSPNNAWIESVFRNRNYLYNEVIAHLNTNNQGELKLWNFIK